MGTLAVDQLVRSKCLLCQGVLRVNQSNPFIRQYDYPDEGWQRVIKNVEHVVLIKLELVPLRHPHFGQDYTRLALNTGILVLKQGFIAILLS